MAFLWALALGVSVTLDGKCKVVLNSHSDQAEELHSLQVSFTVMALAMVPLSLSFFRQVPLQRPALPACFAGVCTLFSFAGITAAGAFGFRVTFLTQLLGTICMSAAVDVISSRGITCVRLFGISMVFLSSALLLQSRPDSSDGRPHPSEQAWISLVLVALTGAGYVVQATGTGTLKVALGDAFRAAFVCNLVTVICWVPMLAIVQMPLQVQLSDWWLWAASVAQNIFYLSSMTVLPTYLSFAATFTTVITGQLVSAAAIDLVSAGTKPPLGMLLNCCLGLGIALLGAFLSLPEKKTQEQKTQGQVET